MRFEPDWKSGLFVALMLPVLVALGFWQMARAEEKRQILSDHERRRALPPVDVNGLERAENFRPIFMQGSYDAERYWLLDNRIENGKFGFQVVSVFVAKGGNEVLVDRGWLPGDVSRRTLPLVKSPAGETTLVGEVWVPSGGFSLGEALPEGWPRLVQNLDPEVIERQFGERYVMRLAPGQQGALLINRSVVNQTPAKHIGYAVQWFAMAFALVALFIYRNVSKV